MIRFFRKHTISITLIIMTVYSLPLAASAGPSIIVPKHVPAGDALRISVNAGEQSLTVGTIEVIYRPGSKVEHRDTLEFPPIAAGTETFIFWRPAEAGIVRLDYLARVEGANAKAKPVKADAMVGVLFPKPPITGIVIMLLAALILFSGCFFSFRLLREDKDEDKDEGEDKDRGEDKG